MCAICRLAQTAESALDEIPKPAWLLAVSLTRRLGTLLHFYVRRRRLAVLIGRKVAIGAVALAAWVSGTRLAHSDGMLLVKDRHVKLFEPRQQAIVGWNGTEEILILRVIVRASHAIDALRVVPFPAEPTVTKGDARAFERIVDLVNNSMETRRSPSLDDSVPAKPSMPAQPAGKVTMYKVIGLHQITVAHVLSKEGFVDWVKTTMNPSAVEQFDVPAQSIATIADYLASGTQWFAFDELTLSEKPEQTEPLEYRFKSGAVDAGDSGTSVLPVLEPWIYVSADNSGTKSKDLRALRLGESGIVDEVNLIDSDAALGVIRVSPDRRWLVYTEQNLKSRADCLCFVDMTADVPEPQRVCNFTANRDVWNGQWYWNKSFIGGLYEYDTDQNLVTTTYWQFDPAALSSPVRIDMPTGYLYSMRVNADGVSAALTRDAGVSLDTVYLGNLRPEEFEFTSLVTYPVNTVMDVELSHDSQKLATIWTTNIPLYSITQAGVTVYEHTDAGWNGVEFPGRSGSVGIFWGKVTNRLLVNWGYPGSIALARPNGTLVPVINASGPLWVDGDQAIMGRAAPASNVAPDQLLWCRVDDNGPVGNVVSITPWRPTIRNRCASVFRDDRVSTLTGPLAGAQVFMSCG